MAPALVILAAGLGRRFGGLKQLAAVGPGGEPLIDYTAHDAARAGFDKAVLVVRSEIAGAVAAHVESCWPPELDVELVDQMRDPALARLPAWRACGTGVKPLGTAQAVLAARDHVSGSFAAVNADDMYGPEAFSLLRRHLDEALPPAGWQHALVGFELARSFSGSGPVSRAICTIDGDGMLASVREASVRRTAEGELEATLIGSRGGVGLRPGGRALVSTNMWGFRPSIFDAVNAALNEFLAAGSERREDELRLPDVIDAHLQRGGSPGVRVIRSGGRCLGVTHASDLDLARREIEAMVEQRIYPDPLWGGPGRGRPGLGGRGHRRPGLGGPGRSRA